MFTKLKDESLKWQTMIDLAVTTGMRRGKLLAIDINKHIHFKKINSLEVGYIDVKQSLAYVNGKPIFKDVKTKKSERTITLTNETIPLLKEQINEVKKTKEQLGDDWEGNDRLLLFPQWNGKPMYFTSPTTWLRRFLKKNDLKHIPFHYLRHSMATYMLSKGRSLKEIQERLGHADIRTTANIYTHYLKELDFESAQTFSELKNKT
ncbi:site-specific integrase [Chengkuizengella axinellae]